MLTCARALRDDFPYITFSSVYRTAARDEESQDDFLNAVAKIDTDESPEEVHYALQSIEEDLGKDPPYEKGPRTIDLDILLYDPLPPTPYALPPTLSIPHPRMTERRFVLEPLCELCEGWKPQLEKTLDQSCEKIDLRL
jgi:2-amino-4-hydroxy-6-hydroxymethyldihydropteridine diphosphokinase